MAQAGRSALHTSTDAELHCPGSSHSFRHFSSLKFVEQMPLGRSTPTSRSGHALACGDRQMAALSALTFSPPSHLADLSHMACNHGLQIQLRRYHLVRTLPGSTTSVRTVATLGRVRPGGLPLRPPQGSGKPTTLDSPSPSARLTQAGPLGKLPTSWTCHLEHCRDALGDTFDAHTLQTASRPGS